MTSVAEALLERHGFVRNLDTVCWEYYLDEADENYHVAVSVEAARYFPWSGIRRFLVDWEIIRE